MITVWIIHDQREPLIKNDKKVLSTIVKDIIKISI